MHRALVTIGVFIRTSYELSFSPAT
jgi:hypothetical protein